MSNEFVRLSDDKHDSGAHDSSTDELTLSGAASAGLKDGGADSSQHSFPLSKRVRSVSLFEANDDLSAEGCIAVKSMVGYKKVLWCEVLHVVLAICTGFLWLLSNHWFPKFHYRFRFRRVANLEDAEYVFVEAEQGAPELCRVQPLREQCVRIYVYVVMRFPYACALRVTLGVRCMTFVATLPYLPIIRTTSFLEKKKKSLPYAHASGRTHTLRSSHRTITTATTTHSPHATDRRTKSPSRGGPSWSLARTLATSLSWPRSPRRTA